MYISNTWLDVSSSSIKNIVPANDAIMQSHDIVWYIDEISEVYV